MRKNHATCVSFCDECFSWKKRGESSPRHFARAGSVPARRSDHGQRPELSHVRLATTLRRPGRCMPGLPARGGPSSSRRWTRIRRFSRRCAPCGVVASPRSRTSQGTRDLAGSSARSLTSCSAIPMMVTKGPWSSLSRRRSPDPPGRYQVFGEIARGGMGAVLKGAIPTSAATWPSRCCSSSTATTPELVRRFVEEAQIGGQLQHPGIVPVYELGTFADRPALFHHEAGQGPNAGRSAERADRRSTPTCRASSDLRAGLPDGRLCPRPGSDPSRPEAVERDGRLASARSR